MRNRKQRVPIRIRRKRRDDMIGIALIVFSFVAFSAWIGIAIYLENLNQGV